MSSILEFDDSIRNAAKEAAWLHSIVDIPGSSSDTTPNDEESTDKIRCHIPDTLAESEDYNKYYEPRVVSIGPYYYFYRRCHYDPMEKFKRKAVRELLLGTFYKNRSVSIEKVYKSVEQDLLSVRDYYMDLPSSIPESDWCQMMFRDGCFVIYFIISHRRRWFNFMKKHDRDLVCRDLLLIRNQLPFQVLSVLQQAFGYEEFTVGRVYMRLHRMLLTTSCHSVPPTLDDYMNKVTRQQGKPLHILQCYRDLWIYILFGDHVEEDDNEENEEQAEEEDHLAICPHYSVTELKKVGIRCSWASNSMKGIHLKISMLSGKLFLPKLIIDEWTMTTFYNLVAYEYSYNLQNRPFGITSYLSFMSMLINGEEDVKELRAREVLQLDHKVGDDQVVNFLRNITADRDPNPQDFKDVKQQIFTYLKSKCLVTLRIGYAELNQRYFIGP